MESLLRDHPWSEDELAKGRPLDYLWRFDLSLSPDELWPYVIETSRLNRSIGVGEMKFDEVNGVLHGSSRNAGVRQEWIEVPWDWVAGRTLTSVRRFSRGLAHVARGIYRLDERAGGAGTSLYVYFGWIPRGLYGRMCIALGMPWLRRGYDRVLASIEADAGKPVTDIAALREDPPPLEPATRARLSTLRDEVVAMGADAAAIDKLLHYVEHGDETDLYRIQIRPLARDWGVDEDALLLACLYGTRAGLLDLGWDVICPHCRGVRFEATTLGDVGCDEKCEVCDVEFSTEADNALEITFHVHPSIRAVPRVYYCSAEPATKLHIQLQQRLAPGETRLVTTRIAPGRYRMRVRGGRAYRFLDVGDSAVAEPVDVDLGALVDLSTGRAPTLHLRNSGADVRTVVVENVQWADDALRPSRLFSLQEFRDLFSKEYLAADIQLSVGEQTILFTDMVGSTSFYGSRGDPEAFMEVRRHFTEVYEEVRNHRGAVIKTIGDAAMAAFTDPVDAVEAAAAIMRRFHPNREDTSIRLRASLNTGPCIAVNLNSGIDYFGGTVNIASKLQALAEGGDIAFSDKTYSSPGVKASLERAGAHLDKQTFTHAALPEPIPVYRWHVS